MATSSFRLPVAASVTTLAARLVCRVTGPMSRWRLHHRGASAEALAGVAEEIAHMFGVHFAAVEVRDPDGCLVQLSRWGDQPGGTVRCPLVYQGQVEGALVLPAGGRWGPRRRRALEEITADLAVAAHIWRTALALRCAEMATESERKRLRRDLHDGLGPVLAALVLQIEATRAFVSSNAATADVKLAELHRDARAAVDDVRRMVYALDPVALDGHSLLSALRLHAARFEQASGGRLRVRVKTPAHLPPLPRETELAIRQIAGEALTNVVRHARASECVVHVDVGDDVHITIVDNGVGLPERPRVGLGLPSIQERVRELDGECRIVRLPRRGTQVHARLPGRARGMAGGMAG
jgi:two-component system NarL family sensor kinase